jgi:hypothetical protein
LLNNKDSSVVSHHRKFVVKLSWKLDVPHVPGSSNWKIGVGVLTFCFYFLGMLRETKVIVEGKAISFLLFCNFAYHIHTEIYSLKTCLIYFRLFTLPNQSDCAYHFFTCEKNDTSKQKPRTGFFHVWETRYVQSEAISCVT